MEASHAPLHVDTTEPLFDESLRKKVGRSTPRVERCSRDRRARDMTRGRMLGGVWQMRNNHELFGSVQ
jgi:hypothetical protein